MDGSEGDFLFYCRRLFARRRIDGTIEIDPAHREAVVRVRLNDDGECPFGPDRHNDSPPVESDKKPRKRACAAAIIAALTDAGKPMSSSQIIRAIALTGGERSDRQVYAELSRLTKSGMVEKIEQSGGNFSYRLPSQNRIN